MSTCRHSICYTTHYKSRNQACVFVLIVYVGIALQHKLYNIWLYSWWTISANDRKKATFHMVTACVRGLYNIIKSARAHLDKYARVYVNNIYTRMKNWFTFDTAAESERNAYAHVFMLPVHKAHTVSRARI